MPASLAFGVSEAKGKVEVLLGKKSYPTHFERKLFSTFGIESWSALMDEWLQLLGSPSSISCCFIGLVLQDNVSFKRSYISG
jgi:hypothetical protein